jgi:hypothetical protein
VIAKVRVKNDIGLHAGPRNLFDPAGITAARLNAVARHAYARLRVDGKEGLWRRWNHESLAFAPGNESTKAEFKCLVATKVEQLVEIEFLEMVSGPVLPETRPKVAKRAGPQMRQGARASTAEAPLPALPSVHMESVFDGWTHSAAVRPEGALFDAYAFADYRGGQDDGPGVVLCFALGGGPVCRVAEVRNRKTLDRTWRRLLRDASARGARLCFGQDHQYGVPLEFALELGLPTHDWRGGIEQLFSGERGARAREAKAGEFARMVNEDLTARRSRPYFWSATKERYRLPSRAPRIDGQYRLTEQSNGFPFSRIGDNGTVGGQTIVGLPRIFDMLRWAEGERIPVAVWPFDGLSVGDIPERAHVMWEPYPTLVRAKELAQSDLNDAHAATLWARDRDCAGALGRALDLTRLDSAGRHRVAFEGWIAGVDPTAEASHD